MNNSTVGSSAHPNSNLHAIAADEQLNKCPILVFLQYEISILQAMSAMHKAMNLYVQTLQDA